MEKQNSYTTNAYSGIFVIFAALFCICLVTSNLFAGKIISVFGFTMSGAVIIFPVSYILNDCLAEVYGFKKAQLVIWLGFFMNILVVVASQLFLLLPAADFWEGEMAFNTVFGATFRATAASMLAFFLGSTLNAVTMSRLKVTSKVRSFSFRAIVSSIYGEAVDSLIFIPIMFWNVGIGGILQLMLGQVVAKVLYEIIILPITKMVVTKVKEYEQIDVYDENISYNPFRIKAIKTNNNGEQQN